MKDEPGSAQGTAPLTELDRRIVQRLQEDLPVVSRPFLAVAERLGITENELLDKIREFMDDGTIRRFGATLRHQRSGFSANAMVVWRVKPEEAERVAHILSSFREVTHCYQRPALPGWPYRLFTMIHGRFREECEALARRMANHAGVEDYRLLFTEDELKKTTMVYFDDVR
jgi:DNA-binding Lrp family transcriptional regulator